METSEIGQKLYEPLPGFILSNAAAVGAKDPPVTSKLYVEDFVKTALKNAGNQYVDRTYDRKVRGKVLLLDNPGQSKPPGESAVIQTITARERRRLAEDKATGYIYTMYEPLHKLWLKHAVTVLKASDAHRAVHDLLEWRGCLATVAEARDSGVVGVQGIIIDMTRNTLKMVTPENRAKVIARQGTVLSFEVNGMEVTAPMDC